ncbi:MAG: glycosyl transferase group 1 [Phycisphaerales bacterium]|nr:glycosyl transferase group 1 [Phycisphaerales bacterium]
MKDESAGGILKGLRLLIVADSSTTHTHRWAHWARNGGASVTVLSPFADAIEGVRVVKFPHERRWYHRIPKARMLLDLIPFRRMLREIDPQLIHFHFVSEGGRAFYWDKVRVPMVASTWGQDVIFDKGPDVKAQASLTKMLGRCRVVTATTHQLARETARYLPQERPIYVIPFGVDLPRFAAPAGWASPSTSNVTLGFVKWLKPKYGPDVMVEAFARIHSARPNTRLVLAGKGEMQESLQARVNELGLQDAVQILGRVDHERVPALIRSFDIMVMPSVYESETFGVAAIEASASGVPVVASRVGGVPEAVLHERTGLLVPPRDVEALARACIELIDDPARRRAMGVAGRRFVERYYSWPDNTRLMGEVYRAAVEGRNVRGVPVYQAGKEPDLGVPEA